MIANMQIVNHVREDDIRILAVFNLEPFPETPCQLCADNRKQELFAIGMRKSERGIRWVKLSSIVVDAAASAYEKDMIAIFGGGWRDIQDGTTRVMEWMFTRAA